ncbi:hypothetical protein H0H92_001491 [Tricholoma furcatifolium]|nr:hypothetical protein H0H92_001491 [Tricholoma furcatifolium]
MEESIPSLSAGVVGSRFVTESDLDTAKARREEQWKAAYARLGQEPPPQQQEDSYDGRSLAEIAKQEEWEEKTKLANQFRALEEDEIMFLDSIRERQEAEERLRKQQDGEEVKSFREAIAARTSASNNPPPIIGPSAPVTKPKAPTTSLAVKKDVKKTLKGVVVKRKAAPKPTILSPTKLTSPSSKPGPATTGETEPPNPKRQKTSDT